MPTWWFAEHVCRDGGIQNRSPLIPCLFRVKGSENAQHTTQQERAKGGATQGVMARSARQRRGGLLQRQ